MHSSGFEYTYITYPSLTNQCDTFLCWQTVPKQTQSVHLISGSVGCAWQALYILLNNTAQQFAALNVRVGSESHKLSNDTSFLWLFLGGGPFCTDLNESSDSVVKQFLKNCPILLMPLPVSLILLSLISLFSILLIFIQYLIRVLSKFHNITLFLKAFKSWELFKASWINCTFHGPDFQLM